jgi:hypothetical protein
MVAIPRGGSGGEQQQDGAKNAFLGSHLYIKRSFYHSQKRVPHESQWGHKKQQKKRPLLLLLLFHQDLSLWKLRYGLPRHAQDKPKGTSKKGGRCCCWVILLLADVRRQVETLDEVSMADIHLEIGTIRDEDAAGEAPLHPPVTSSGLAVGETEAASLNLNDSWPAFSNECSGAHSSIHYTIEIVVFRKHSILYPPGWMRWRSVSVGVVMAWTNDQFTKAGSGQTVWNNWSMAIPYPSGGWMRCAHFQFYKKKTLRGFHFEHNHATMRCSRARATTPSLSLHNVIHACAAGFFSFPLALALRTRASSSSCCAQAPPPPAEHAPIRPFSA